MDATKKRNRIPASCSVCRRRKSKCDRIKPICGSCRKKSIAHLCYYEHEDERDIERHVMEIPVNQIGHPIMAGHPGQPGLLGQPAHQPGHQLGQMQHSSVLSQAQGPGHMLGQLPPGMPPAGVPGAVPGGVPGAVPGAIPGPGGVMMLPYSPHGPTPYSPHGPTPHMTPHQMSPNHSVVPPQNYYYGSVNEDEYSVPGLGSNTASMVGTGPNTSPSSAPGSNTGSGPGSGPASAPVSMSGSTSYSASYHPIAPPPNAPPAPNNVTIMPHHIPPLNYVEDGNVLAGSTNPLLHRNSVQLPPIKGNSDGTVVVSIGPNSTLRINPNDEIEHFFDNASFPLSLEGPYLQSHGPLTYVGLTKSDRYVKFFREFAAELLQKGQIFEFVPKKKRKRTGSDLSPNNRKKSQNSTPLTQNSNVTTPRSSMKASYSESMIRQDSSNSTLHPPKFQSDDAIPVKSDPGVENQGNGLDKSDEEGEERGEDDEDEEDDEEVEETENKAGETEDILAITKTNVAEDSKESDEKDVQLSVLPGLQALYMGPNARKEYYKLVEHAVLKIFPSRNIALLLFTKFFKWIHPFVPFFNESMLINDFNQVLDEFPSFKKEKYTSITIKSDKHLTIVGILLVILRLGYLSLIHNHGIHNQYNENEMAIFNESKVVSFKTFADVVNLCIPDEHSSPRSTIRIVQLLALIYFYRQVSPNDCHGVGGADSQILFGATVRHAFSIGLNRDPMKYYEHETITQNAELKEVWRNLWHYLVVTDATTSMLRSSILSIPSDLLSDVKFPCERDKLNLEYWKFQSGILEICKCYRKINQIFCNYHEKPKIIEVLAETNKLEHIFFQMFGKDFFKDAICKPAKDGKFSIGSQEHEDSYLKVMKYQAFISLRADLTSIYYVIAMNFERKDNEKKTSITSGVELFKIHFKSVVQLLYIMSYVFDNSVELFGKNYDYILTALNERHMIKTHSFLTSFFIRLMHQKQLLTFKGFEPAVAERLAAIDKLFNMVLAEAELFVGNFRQLSIRYVNSYKIYVLSYYVLKQCMENVEVFFKYALKEFSLLTEAANMLEFFTAGEINYLCKLCEEFRFAKDSQERQRKANAMFNSDFAKGFGGDSSTDDDIPATKNYKKASGTRHMDANLISTSFDPSEPLGRIDSDDDSSDDDAFAGGSPGLFKDRNEPLPEPVAPNEAMGLDQPAPPNNIGGPHDLNFRSGDFLKFLEVYDSNLE